MRGKIPEEKAVDLLSNLDVAAFEFHYGTLSKYGELIPDALAFSCVKTAMFERFVENFNV